MIVKAKTYRCYAIPPEFWVALMQVRQHWLQNEEFVGKVYGLAERDERLRSAYCLVDCVIDAFADLDALIFKQ